MADVFLPPPSPPAPRTILSGRSGSCFTSFGGADNLEDQGQGQRTKQEDMHLARLW